MSAELGAGAGEPVELVGVGFNQHHAVNPIELFPYPHEPNSLICRRFRLGNAIYSVKFSFGFGCVPLDGQGFAVGSRDIVLHGVNLRLS